MICESCREGGDLSKGRRERWPAGRPGGRTTESNRWTGMGRRINNAHGRCRGATWCDCQHANTPHARNTCSHPAGHV